MEFLSKIYHVFLYWFGFAEGETITNMLRRQKDRLGVRFWAALTILGILGGLGGALVLMLHVIGVW